MENEWRNIGDVEEFVCSLWSEVTLNEVQLAFHKQMRRFE
jgi:hypothetical protein